MQGVWGLCEPSDYDSVMAATNVMLPVGANFGGRRDAFLSVGFNPEFGRKGTELLSYEETELMEQLIESGKFGYWVPGAMIAHRVPESRMQLDYIARFYAGLGRSHWACRRQPSRFTLLRKYPKYFLRSRRKVSLQGSDFNLKDFTRVHY